MNREDLLKSLEKIGWKFHGRYPNERIVDHEGKGKDIRITSDRLEIQQKNVDCCFYFKGCKVYELDNSKGEIDCVGIQSEENNDVFIQFYNHDK